MNVGQEERGTKRRGTAAPAWKKPPMRNETTRSAILSSPTPLALVCVLFLILMHIQWLDLHYILTAQWFIARFAVGCGALVLALS